MINNFAGRSSTLVRTSTLGSRHAGTLSLKGKLLLLLKLKRTVRLYNYCLNPPKRNFCLYIIKLNRQYQIVISIVDTDPVGPQHDAGSVRKTRTDFLQIYTLQWSNSL